MKRIGFVFKQDDACHWYLVPENQVSDFSDLLARAESGDQKAEDKFIKKFDHLRCGHPANFTIYEYEDGIE